MPLHSRPRSLALLLFSIVTLGASAPPLPSTTDITALTDAQKYRDALPLLTRVLDLKGPAAAPYDRHQLLMLKAECLLQLRDFPNTLTTLATAQKEAKKIPDAYDATALAALVHKSPTGIFTHKSGTDSQKFNILDLTERTAAFKLLWADQLASMKADVKADKADASILPLIEDVQAMAIARALEFTATGKTTETDKFAQQLKTRAVKLLDNNLKRMTTKLDNVTQKANTKIVTIDDGVRSSRKAGLTFAAIQSLRDIESTCDQFPAVVAELARNFPDDPKTFTDIAARAAALEARAAKTRTAQY